MNVDHSGYQLGDEHTNVDLPVLFLDHDYRDPDRDAIRQAIDRYEPQVAVIGDAYTLQDADALDTFAAEVRTTYDDVEPVIAPKCGEALDIIDDQTVLGWAAGTSTRHPNDFSRPADWRARRIHVLGGSPAIQLRVIDQLTQPTLDDRPPADIHSVDWNGYAKGAYHGEYWSADGWQAADHLSIRDTVNRSLQEAKAFYRSAGIWPGETPVDTYGPAVVEPDDNVFMDRGGDPITARAELETAVIGRYGDPDDPVTMAFESEAGKAFTESRAGLLREYGDPVDP